MSCIDDLNDIFRPNDGAPARFAAGQRVRVVRDSMSHNYPVGECATVSIVDTSDGTYQLIDARSGRTGGWVPERDLESASALGWEWLQTVLPAEDLALLRAFDGLHGLNLAQPIRDALLGEVPNLKATILRVTPEPLQRAATTRRKK